MSIDLFRTRDHVARFDDWVRDYGRASEEARRRHRSMMNVPYGKGRAETLDLFLPEAGGRGALPVHMFIHGGYWRMFAKEDFSFIADTVLSVGAIAVVVDYALMPGARLREIVAQVRGARAWVANCVADHGGDPRRFTVSGHSAGAHLASFLLADEETDPVRAALLLGGIYDIRPLQMSFLQPLIGLTDEEVQSCSPVDHRHRAGTDVTILVGEKETAPFHDQARVFARRLGDDGCRVETVTLADADHMSSVYDLGVPGRPAADLLAAMIERH